MNAVSKTPLYRHRGIGLVRAAALTEGLDWWPDPGDAQACRAWLGQVWALLPTFVEGIRQASPDLAARVEAIHAGAQVSEKQVLRAATATTRYLLRATGRHVPFGLFAGAAPVTVGPTAAVRWGPAHQVFARVDTQWLADVVGRLESSRSMLERLTVVFSDLAVVRGRRLELPCGPDRVSINYTSLIHAVRHAAADPVRFGDLAAKISAEFPDTDSGRVHDTIAVLVRQGFLITSLRAPMTVVDPLDHVLQRLSAAAASDIPAVTAVQSELEQISAHLGRHNAPSIPDRERAGLRATIATRMRELSTAGRTPLAVELRLDCEVQLPEAVAHEMEWAASALMRLSRQPTGDAAWRTWYTAFYERYGTGTLVRLGDVVDPDTGLGYPPGYPGSTLPTPPAGVTEQDGKLLALAWQALGTGCREIVLDEDTLQDLSISTPDTGRRIPPHVELAARVNAASPQALQRGEFTLTVAPARSAGTLTSRFTTICAGSGLEEVYASVPTIAEDAIPVQLSFPPVYPHAENIARVPAYLPHVVSLGEHRNQAREAVIGLDDLAITATGDGLHLVSLSRNRVLDPQAFHALALQKQPPPLARFLAHLSRALIGAWHEFTWPPAAEKLAYLPAVRYRKSVLCRARWRLTTDDLTSGQEGRVGYRHALGEWRRRWICPERVELLDEDRSLPLNLTEPTHVAILGKHLHRHGYAVLVETPSANERGWIEAHAHQIALPMITSCPPAPSPLAHRLPVVRNRSHGHLPGAPASAWVYAKIHTSAERMDTILTEYLPRLLDTLEDEAMWWFIRYRSPHETDHLRLRLRPRNHEQLGRQVSALGTWAQNLRDDGIAGRLSLDTYEPEIGRYGVGPAMFAAETVFAADSRAVVAQLRHLPASVLNPSVLTALGLIATVHGFLGDHRTAMRWLAARPTHATAGTPTRAAADEVIRLARGDTLEDLLEDLPARDGDIASAWVTRDGALRSYRSHLPADADADAILESLLHMHHCRAIGIDRDGERARRKLARQAALAWTAQQGVPNR